jgi:hypothetical protein
VSEIESAVDARYRPATGGHTLTDVADRRGAIVGWSAGVSGTAATLAALFAVGKTFLYRTLFTVFLAVAVIAFVILLGTGLQGFVSWWRGRAGKLPLAGGRPLAEFVEISVGGRLPRVAELNPYKLGATPSEYGNADTYGRNDEYVPRTRDEPLVAALRPGRLVVVVGPSKAGKTRTAFEAIRGHDLWRGALLATPEPRSLNGLAGHPALGGSDPLVIWLDDLQYFLPQEGELSQAMIARLLDRPGKTVLLATLRTEQRELLRGPDRELTREVRMVFDNADWIELASTRDDDREQARAAAIYPQLRFRPEGLAETLAGAPGLLQWYRDAAAVDPPLLRALVQTCVDWARCGLARAMPEPDLLAVARDAIEVDRPYLNVRDDQMEEALQQASKPTAGGGQVALLLTQWLPDRSRGYRPFDYLVAADDGQGGQNARPVTATARTRCWQWRSPKHTCTPVCNGTSSLICSVNPADWY